jgi:hypothetical protein
MIPRAPSPDGVAMATIVSSSECFISAKITYLKERRKRNEEYKVEKEEWKIKKLD